jgi:pyrroloquinoline quinone (PQQ) biosynthesis protein C
MEQLQRITEDAIKSNAVNHEFLQRFGHNDYENMDFVISSLAYNYYEYSKNFQRYLCALIAKLESGKHRSLLLENLFEETGNLHEEDIVLLKEIGIEREWVDGIDHPTLFRNFLKKVTPTDKVEWGKKWSMSFLDEIQKSSELRALGMLSVGTESIVKYIYKYLLEGLRKSGRFTEQDLVFFTLHSEIDDEHGEIMHDILRELLAETPEKIDDVIDGVNKALELRTIFWNGVAQSIPQFVNL